MNLRRYSYPHDEYLSTTRVLPEPQQQPDPLRQRALEMAIGCHNKEACSLEGILHNANAFYTFLKGELV